MEDAIPKPRPSWLRRHRSTLLLGLLPGVLIAGIILYYPLGILWVVSRNWNAVQADFREHRANYQATLEALQAAVPDREVAQIYLVSKDRDPKSLRQIDNEERDRESSRGKVIQVLRWSSGRLEVFFVVRDLGGMGGVMGILYSGSSRPEGYLFTPGRSSELGGGWWQVYF